MWMEIEKGKSQLFCWRGCLLRRHSDNLVRNGSEIGQTSKGTENRQPASTPSPTRGMPESGVTVADSPPTWAKNLTTSVQGGLDNIFSRLSNMEQTLAVVRTELKDFKEALSSLGETVSAHDSRTDALEAGARGSQRHHAVENR
ncbi:hypothetical protein SRHO_G00131620 [Serrasalmus rhombeus]